MQTQDAPAEFLFKLWPWLEANQKLLIRGTVIALVAIGAYSFYVWQHGETEIAAGEALTQTLLNTSHADASQLAGAFGQVATQYSGTAAGGRAQLQAAATLFGAGKYPEALAQFQKYISANPAGNLLVAARLGVAASLEAQGKLDDAAADYRQVAGQSSDAAAQLAAKFSLGRIAELKGKPADAVNFYQEVSRSSLGGSLVSEAAMRMTEIKTRLATAPAAAPKPAAK